MRGREGGRQRLSAAKSTQDIQVDRRIREPHGHLNKEKYKETEIETGKERYVAEKKGKIVCMYIRIAYFLMASFYLKEQSVQELESAVSARLHFPDAQWKVRFLASVKGRSHPVWFCSEGCLIN